MPKKYSEAPFYERDNIIKNYYKLLAIPGRYAQSAEFTEIQSVLLDCIKSIGDSLFKDGNVQSGCDLRIDGNTVTISSGRIYLDGVVRQTSEQVVPITGQGTEAITARLEETLVTENEDTTLLDPAVTASSAYQPGCFRVKQEVVFEINGDGSLVATLVDGELVNYITEKPQMDIINEVLARRTFAESGNYVVNGFSLKALDYTTDDNQLLVGLSKGQAFIKGFEVTNPTDITFTIDKAVSSKDVVAEPKTYTTSNKTFPLINTPVKDVNRVLVTIASQTAMNYNSLISEYALPVTPVASITSVTSSDITYINNTDYKLQDDKLVWLSGSKPSNGTNFTVNYTYKKVLVKDTDYTVDSNMNITITNNTVQNNSEVLIDYSYYLARQDTICLDSNGVPVVVKGTDADLEDCLAPDINDLSCLSLGSVLVYPNSTKYDVFNSTVKVSTMERIQNAIDRLDKLEYNNLMTTLDQEYYNQEASEQLRGMFTEAFVSYDRVDTTFEGVNLSMDFERGRMYPPFEENNHALSITSNPNNKYAIIGDVYTLPYSSKEVISQMNTTGKMKVNPYQAFDPIMAIEITPSIDTWVNTSKVTETINRVVTQSYMWWSDYMRHQSSTTSTLLSSQVIKDSESLYMRQRDIKIVSRTFPTGANNVRCTFDGRHVDLTPLNDTSRGTSAGSVRPDSNGLLEASFKVPNGVPCGTVEVKLYDGNLQGITQYRATGRDRVIRDTILVTTTKAKYIDPLAETFVLNDTRVLTGIDLFFADKDDKSVTVEIRNVEVGFPGKLIYTSVTIPSSKINVSSNGSVATHIDFPNIVQCEKDTEYAVIILTESPNLSAYICTLGEKTLDGSKYITSNPYNTGVLLSSSNASTWTAHQDKDLKFKLYGAEFEFNGEINFSNVTINSADRLIYTVDILNSVSSNAIMYANINNEGYKVVAPWSLYELTSHARSCAIKIIMNTNNKYQSSFVNKDSASMVSFISESSATYVTKNNVLDTACQEVKVILNTSNKTSNTIKVYIATDKTGTSWTEIPQTGSTVYSTGIKQLEFSKNSMNITNFRIKVTLSTTNTCNEPYISKLGVILNVSV